MREVPKFELTREQSRKKLAAYIRKHPNRVAESALRHVTGHGKCPPCCRGWEAREAQAALTDLINSGHIEVRHQTFGLVYHDPPRAPEEP